MGLLGRTALITALLVLLCPPAVSQASDAVPGAPDSGARDTRTELIRADEETFCTVQSGDSLWTIAAEQLGDGARYPELADLNSDIISNPDLIYPGMVLQLPAERIWLVNNERQMPMGDYSFAVPAGMSVSYLSSGAAWSTSGGETSANFTLTDNGLNFIACLVQDRDETLAESVADWDACCRSIGRYAQSSCRDTVSELAFERYLTETGEDVLLFSYVYRLDLAPYGQSAVIPVDVCMGIRLTGHLQAQFLGVGIDGDIHSQVLVATGSFTELAEPDASYAEAGDMAILPAYSWEIDGMFNPFPWVEQFYDEISREAFDIPAAQSLREKFLNNPKKP